MLAVLYGSAFVAAFNENTINVALISIMGEFAVDANTAQWLVTGYMIVTAIVVTVSAFLTKRLRLRTLFLAAAGFLTFGLVAAMLAPTWPLFLAARLVQAVGTGIFIPVMMSTVLAVAPRTRMGTYLSIGGCMITFGPAFAPVVSGLMVTTLGWRSIFLPPAALIVVLALLGVALIRNITEPEKIKLDGASVVLSAVGLTSFVFGLSLVMASPMVAVIAIAVGLAVMGAFVVRQHRIPNPLLNLTPMRNRLFAPVCVLIVVAMMTTFSMSVLLPLYFEGALGTTALAAGALLLAPILVNAVTSLVGGRVMDKRGSWPLLPAGFAVITVGQLAVCLCAPALSLGGVLAASVVVYAGVGLVLSSSQTAGLQTLAPEQNPHGVAILNTFIQIAAAVGPSLFIGVLSSVAGSVEAAGTADALAQAEGFSAAVAVACVIAGIGMLTAFAYARKRQRLAEAVLDASMTGAVSPTVRPEAVEHGPEALTAHDLMKAPYVVADSASVREVMAQLIDRKTSGLPVVDGRGAIVGFVTDGDVLASLGKPDAAGFDLTASLAVIRDMRNFDERFAETLSANVMDIATTSIVSVAESAPIDEVCALLSTKRIKKVPVLAGRRVVGTISRADIVRTLMAQAMEVSK